MARLRREDREEFDEPNLLAALVYEYVSLAVGLQADAEAGIESANVLESDRQIATVVMALLPWIEAAPADDTAENVVEYVSYGNTRLTDAEREAMRQKLEGAMATDQKLRRLWEAVEMPPFGTVDPDALQQYGRALVTCGDYLHDHLGLNYDDVNAAIRIRLGVPEPDLPNPVQTASESVPANGPKTGPGASLSDRCLTELKTLLATAEETGDAETLLATVPKKIGHLSDGQYSNFVRDVRLAMKESSADLYIDLRALGRARTEATKRMARNSAFTEKVDRAFKDGKSTIVVSNRQLADLRDDAVCRLRDTNDPALVFQRQRELVRYRSDAAGDPYLEPLTDVSLRGRLSDVANFLAESAMGGYVAVIPPRALCEDVLAYPHPPGTFPVVEAITRTPLVRADGTILATPGYDPATKMIYAPPPGFTLPPIPDAPTSEDIDAAKTVLLDVVQDFPFESGADRTNFFGFCLTPVVRSLVDVVPMAAIDSPVAGSGKGLLTDVAAVTATGEVAAVIPPPANREEWPKLLSSLLDNGRTFIVFDNLHETLKSDALEAVLTKPFLQFRQLGHTRERIVPNRAVWAVTGNNVAVSRDMVRRCFRIRIDPRCAQPHLRKNFRYPNLVQYCKAKRRDLLAALLVLVRAWIVAGRPACGGSALGTYTQWREMVGGILKHAGFNDFLGNQRMLYSDMDVESEEWESFLTQIYERFVLSDFAVSDVVNIIHAGTITVLPREVAKIYGQSTSHKDTKPNAFFGVQLGHILRAHRGTRYGEREIYLERGEDDRHKKVARYRICIGSRSTPAP